MARWQSGHAAACKAVYAGSIPTLASNKTTYCVSVDHNHVKKNADELLKYADRHPIQSVNMSAP